MSAFYDWDWAGAERRLARAIELNPGNALMRLWNGHHYSIVGRWDEAIAEVQQAQDCDLLSPIVVAIVGWTSTWRSSRSGPLKSCARYSQSILATPSDTSILDTRMRH